MWFVHIGIVKMVFLCSFHLHNTVKCNLSCNFVLFFPISVIICFRSSFQVIPIERTFSSIIQYCIELLALEKNMNKGLCCLCTRIPERQWIENTKKNAQKLVYRSICIAILHELRYANSKSSEYQQQRLQTTTSRKKKSFYSFFPIASIHSIYLLVRIHTALRFTVWLLHAYFIFTSSSWNCIMYRSIARFNWKAAHHSIVTFFCNI